MTDIRAMMQDFVEEVMNKHNLAKIDEFVSLDVVEHEEMPPGFPAGREGVKQFFGMMIEAFPDFRAEISHIIVEGDTAVLRTTMSGTQKGEFMGVPSEGKRFEVPVIDILRWENGQVVEHWGSMDNLMMMQQLGAIPA